MKRTILSTLLAGVVIGTTLTTPAFANEKTEDTLTRVELPKTVGIESTDETESAIEYIKNYVDSAFALEDKEREAEILRRQAEKDKRASISQNFAWQSKYTEAGMAAIDSKQKARDSKQWARDMYKYGRAPEQRESEDMVTDLFLDPAGAESKLGTYNQLTKSSTDNKAKLESSKERETEAKTLQKDAVESKTSAENTAVSSIKTTNESKKKTQELSVQTVIKEQKYEEASVEFNALNLDKDDKSSLTLSQRAINQAIVDRWNDYLTKLDEADIEVPTLADFKDKKFYKKNDKLVPYKSLSGKSTPNVAALKSDPNTYVLPAETIKQVSSQLEQSGQKYSKKGTGEKNKWSCSAFVSQSYGDDRKLSLDDMWNEHGQVDSLEKLPGDTVFIGSSESGLHHAGTYLGGGMVIASSMPGKTVGIENVGANYFGVKRNTLSPEKDQTKAPKKTDDSVDWECGGVVGGALQGDWLVPLTDGSYEMGQEFGKEDVKRWGDKNKTAPGLEFILTNENPDEKTEEDAEDKDSKDSDTKDSDTKDTDPKEVVTASDEATKSADDSDKDKKDEKDTLKPGVVRASGSGIIKVDKSKEWGNIITITHKDDITTRYTFLDKTLVKNGAKVNKGDAIATIGKTGKKAPKKKSLMFIMEKEGKKVDPKPFLFPSAVGSFSGNFNKVPEDFSTDYDNGKLPDSILCPILDNGHKIRCEAVPAFLAVNTAYKQTFGQDICITDSYRSYAAQVDVKRRKPGLAAVPGTSNHGWGLALDLCGGIQTFGTPQHEWMVQNAHRFGWFHPDWAHANGSKPEAWHWESVLSTKE